MYSSRRFSAIPIAILLLAGSGTASRAQSAPAVAATARISGPVEPRQTARLHNHVPDWATAANDLGSIAPNRHLDLHLTLARAPQVQAAFEQLLANQQNPASPHYHQWLTPQENAAQYGIAASDLTAVTGWLQSQGLTLQGVAAGGVFITFSGPASVVENAFSTTIHTFSHENAARYAPTADPAIPAALTGVIQSVGGLTEQMAYVHSHQRPAEVTAQTSGESPVHPLYTSGGGATHYVTPGDFNIIYNINPTYNAGFTGTGFRVVNLIDSRIAPADITGFNKVFGLSVAQPNQIVLPGSTDPGLTAGSEGEAALDVQRILGTAPGTTVDLLVFANLSFNNIYNALQYEISTLNDPIVNMSFGSCDAGNSGSTAAAFDALFQAGTAQGISFFVSSGDQGAAGCDDPNAAIPATQVLSTNVLCASSYVTCVGGTEFNEGSGSYWSGTNSATKVSALQYIPEGAWNEPSIVSNGRTTYQASGTGGGVTKFPKPSWQIGTGVPADGKRDVPDMSFTASGHDGYLICQVDVGNDCSSGVFKFITFGTSASSPSMAGVAALLNQKLNARQGNLNPLFYKLATTPSNNVFHDTTAASSGVSSCSTAIPSMCNNSTPAANSLTGGLAGYAVTNGYDLATGLGSLDVTNFLTAAAAPTVTATATSLALAASANPITTNQTVTLTATLTASSAATPTGTIQFFSNGTSLGTAALTSGGTASTAALTFPTAGTYSITAVYSGDSAFLTSAAPALSLVVTSPAAISPTFSIAPVAATLSLVSGATTGNTDAITLTSLNGFTGNIALNCSVSTGNVATQPKCSIAPTSVTISAGGTATAVATFSTTAQVGAHANPAFAAVGAMFAGVLCLLPFHRRRAIRSLAATLVLFGGLAAISGCGSGVAALAKAAANTGTYTVTITGTGTPTGGSNSIIASTTVALTVD